MFEGSDGVGKSTQLEKAAAVLQAEGWDVLKTRNLGGTPIGEALREVSFSLIERPAETDLYISAAIQAALIKAIQAERQKGRIILMDRGPLSLAVYQVHGSGVDEKLGWQFADLGMQAFKPELVILYKANIEVALERARAHSGKADYFENQPLDFFKRVDQGFDEAAERYKVSKLDAEGSIEAVHQATMQLIYKVIETNSKH